MDEKDTKKILGRTSKVHRDHLKYLEKVIIAFKKDHMRCKKCGTKDVRLKDIMAGHDNTGATITFKVECNKCKVVRLKTSSTFVYQVTKMIEERNKKLAMEQLKTTNKRASA